jgi:hypothetical protein
MNINPFYMCDVITHIGPIQSVFCVSLPTVLFVENFIELLVEIISRSNFAEYHEVNE